MRSCTTLLRSGLVSLIVLSVYLSTSHSATAANKAAIKKSTASAVSYLRSLQGDLRDGRASLAAYAMMKADVKPNDPAITKAISDILLRCKEDDYRSVTGDDAIYTAGIEAMILSEVDPEKYQPQLKKIAAFLIRQQKTNGSFDYRNGDDAGDTSVTQYGTLGLWAVARVGIEVPPEVWDKLAAWHFRVHEADGGFAYAPGRSEGITGRSTNGSMTAAAAASMTICAMFLHPAQMQQINGITDGLMQNREADESDPNNPLGVLNVRNADPKETPAGPYAPKASFDDLQAHIKRAVQYVTNHFTVEYHRDSWRHYHYYTIERMGSLVNVDRLGSHDWFDEFADELIRTQLSDGSWNMPGMETGNNHCVATSFAVLFLTRSTAKLLNRLPPEDPLGGGIQAGGRGLPDDLTTVRLQDGRVAEEKSTGPLDDLLKSLESADIDDLFDVQTQIVKKVQLGDRKELIGQIKRLKDLVEYPNPEIRRIALWALARSDDLTVARHLVAALEDPDADVLTEAHNALCWLSRRPNAFDLPSDPNAELPANATDSQRDAAVKKWRKEALRNWGAWYLKTCSYEEKNTPFAHDLAAKISAR